MSMVREAGLRQLCRTGNLLRCIRANVKGLAPGRPSSCHLITKAQALQMATAPEAPAQSEGVIHKRVVFVVGGPGSGKGTQCDLISRDFHVPFFSAGELIRSLIASGCPEGKQLQDIILQGQIIPSEVTVGLLQKAMAGTSSDTVLIDGFPRNTENRTVWQSQVGYDCEMVLLFDCPDEVMLQRLRGRDQGRPDDNEETIRKRVQNFKSQMAPVLDHYRAIGKVTTIRTDRPIDDIYSELSSLWRQRFATSPVQAV
ncbi:hypothetical protein PLESTB_001527300 [Pleodorina starrii]|uniref:adenylate kinase n=1 Tax=Pleodorina starrii TaxID=330485 RepID=A0A9W6F810_9CHLO|nr:hypothetical protein PLESTM_001166300 [Pleodorina starrii]GLC59729.1 hypothetical protein PLESTB_001527300 [Pleodorina starrii]GLC75349.1 hypothetical protein PLESTF_001626600 [Pleodorina starrii]